MRVVRYGTRSQPRAAAPVAAINGNGRRACDVHSGRCTSSGTNSPRGGMVDVRDRWAAGATYEEFMGRWSRRLAARFVSWLRIPPAVHWLDVGCGTGALASAICSHGAPASVVGCDTAEPFIEFAREHSGDARVSFVIGGTGNLPGRRDGYGSVTSLLALNFFPDPEA